MIKTIFILILIFYPLVIYADWIHNSYTGKPDYHKYKSTAPTNPNDTCTKGDYSLDDDYAYFCRATDTWERVAIDTWVAVDEFILLETDEFILLEDDTSKLMKE